jgi:hypothetical protein
MKRSVAASLLLGLFAGCSGGPLKERPVMEPPPLEEVAAPAPPPPAVPPAPAPAEVYGSWASAALRGPGSAAFERIEILFRRDGIFCAMAVAADRVQAMAGRFELHDGALTLAQEGRERRVEWSLEEDTLVLREGEQGIVLHRVRE